MIHPSKTAAVGSIVLCVAITGAWAQQAEESRRRAERPVPIVPLSPSVEKPFVGPPGLSEEAKRSFTEAPPTAGMREEEAPPEEAPAVPSRSAAAKDNPRPEYVVEPPDLILVEVLEALPGRPISGERLVRPDGRISLGFYGELPVAGLTLPQIKEKIVLHLRKFLNDETLGLIEPDPETNEPRRDGRGRLHVIDPRQTDRVFVDVVAYNSQNYYILGEVQFPGRLPYTGGDRVLDVIQYAGGLLPTADKARIRLIRSFPKGSPPQVLPINYDEIAMGTDSSTNYAMLPYDRLVVPGAATGAPAGQPPQGAANEGTPKQDMHAARARAPQSAPSSYYDRAAYDAAQAKSTAALERRIEELEKKLDRLIEIVEKGEAKPTEEIVRPSPSTRPTVPGAPDAAPPDRRAGPPELPADRGSPFEDLAPARPAPPSPPASPDDRT